MAIAQVAELAESTDPLRYEQCDERCKFLHGGKHRAYGQPQGTRGSKLRRLVGLARALALRIGNEPQLGDADAVQTIAAWARLHLEHKDLVAHILAADVLEAAGACS